MEANASSETFNFERLHYRLHSTLICFRVSVCILRRSGREYSRVTQTLDWQKRPSTIFAQVPTAARTKEVRFVFTPGQAGVGGNLLDRSTIQLSVSNIDATAQGQAKEVCINATMLFELYAIDALDPLEIAGHPIYKYSAIASPHK